MNSDLLTRWTAIITNMAVVIGLAFVGLEFRDNSRSIEAERVESFLEGVSEMTLSAIESEDMSEIIYQMYADPDSLTGARLDRVQHHLLLAHNNFRRMYLQHEAGLLPDEMFEYERRGVGFSFSSDIGLDMVAIFRASTLGGEVWDIIGESAKEARAYCLNPQNACVARYEAARGNSS